MYLLLNSEECVVCGAGVVDEDYIWINMAVCIVKSEFFVVPVINVVLDDCAFFHVIVEY